MKRQNLFTTGQVIIIGIFSVVTGVILGIGGLLAIQNYSKPPSDLLTTTKISNEETIQPQSTIDAETTFPVDVESIPTGNGIFLIEGNELVEVSGFSDDTNIDINSLAYTSEKQPKIVIKGSDFPLGKLSMKSYKAGFGLDVIYQSNGALVNKIYPGTPADKAGLKAGDLIISVGGKKPASSLSVTFTPGHHDLFGPLHPSILVEAIRGTTTLKIDLPRDYRYSNDSMLDSLNSIFRVDFELEPKGDYVILIPKKTLASGVYRIEFQNAISYSGSSSFGVQSGATKTVKSESNSVPNQKWVFFIK